MTDNPDRTAIEEAAAVLAVTTMLAKRHAELTATWNAAMENDDFPQAALEALAEKVDRAAQTLAHAAAVVKRLLDEDDPARELTRQLATLLPPEKAHAHQAQNHDQPVPAVPDPGRRFDA